ncbi:hypothetical protein pdam_00003035 [Pocillopora damicornis]|uniref:PH domain-containing protein n=1 Tax=Pocillopora damicornis TaxID=46731 RepID=A0A3M6U7M3_POCDA|nr:hypothetical protein pdam_00003035 [Pocillopora damicornis]
MEEEFVVKEGWVVKESGQAVLGQTNWRKRWCRLVRGSNGASWSYYRKMDDIASNQPAGRIELNSTYAARELEEGERKKKPNCFALGPVFDDFAKRTYYISCAIPQQTNLKQIRELFNIFSFWARLCQIIESENWKKTDTKNGVTVSRLSFTHNDKAAVKIEGVIPVPPDIAFDYLQLAMKKGGKLDQPFRGEEVLQKVEESVPHASIVYNKYSVPLPSAAPRDVCLQRMWIPSYLTRNGTSGMVLWSTYHSHIPQVQGFTRVLADLSGFVLSPHTSSGLLKVGLRTAFAHISNLVEQYYKCVQG